MCNFDFEITYAYKEKENSNLYQFVNLLFVTTNLFTKHELIYPLLHLVLGVSVLGNYSSCLRVFILSSLFHWHLCVPCFSTAALLSGSSSWTNKHGSSQVSLVVTTVLRWEDHHANLATQL